MRSLLENAGMNGVDLQDGGWGWGTAPIFMSSPDHEGLKCCFLPGLYWVQGFMTTRPESHEAA